MRRIGTEGEGHAVRIVVTGASGYIGQAVQVALLAAGHEVVAVSRRGQAVPGAAGHALDVMRDPLDAVLAGAEAVIHLIGIIREDPAHGVTFKALHVTAAQRMAEAARRAQIARYVHMSALGATSPGASRYFASKWEAEAVVREIVPTATIVRPSLVFGGGADFFKTLGGLVRNPVVPVPGDGRTRFDPLYRGDLATTLASMPMDPDAAGEAFEMGGPRRLTLDGMVDWMGSLRGRRTPLPKLHLPTAALRPLVRWGERLPGFPLTPDQLAMLSVDNITDDVRWHRWVPEPTAPGTDV